MNIKLYSVAELSDILQLHAKTILRFIKEGKIKARKIGRSWMVSEVDLKTYCHAELSEDKLSLAPDPSRSDTQEKVNVSVLVEMLDQDADAASRLSNSLLAMMNGLKGESKGTRFDFAFYPEEQKASYRFFGDPGFIAKILEIFDELNKTKE